MSVNFNEHVLGIGPNGELPPFVAAQLDLPDPAQIDAMNATLTDYQTGQDATDTAVASVVTGTGQARAALDGTYATRRLGLAPGRVAPKVMPYDAQHPVVVDAFGGALWGYQGNAIHRSTDNGATWALYCPSPAGDVVLRLLPTDDGEVISVRVGGVYKSTGWASGSPTWTQKVTANGQAAIQQFQVDGDGTKFIVAEYGPGANGSQAWTDSRYAHISVDGGDTWSVAFDSESQNPGESSHLHGVCYDPWSDRFYLSEGHDQGSGVYVSTDDGATWTRPAGLEARPAPTVLVATDDGIVCASDSADAGVLGIVRQDDPADETLQRTWAWASPGADGVLGFGSRGYRDPDTGVVYFGYTAGQTTVAPIIAGGTASAGGLVWEMPGTGTWTVGDSVHQVVVHDGVLHAARTFSGSVDATYRATLPAPGAGASLVDQGSVLGGTATGSSVAVGNGAAVVAPAYNSVAVGVNATVTVATAQSSMVAIGANSTVTGAGGQAIGSNAAAAASGLAIGAYTLAAGESIAMGANATTTTQTRAIAIGRNSTARVQSVAIGFGATAATGTGAWAVAVGDSAAAALQSVAVGRSTVASATSSVALGYQAVAAHVDSVALGKGSETTQVRQIAVGERHIEGTLLTTGAPGNPAAGAWRLFAYTNGSGKGELAIKFPSGASQIIATEP